MSLIKNLKSREFGSAGGQRAPMLNLAVQVESYDGDRVVGTRLDTGEPVRVFLREFHGNAKKPRPEIADFVATRGFYAKRLSVCDSAEERAELRRGIVNKTEPGGVIVFDACFKDKNGEYSSRWATKASAFEGDYNVITNAMVRVNATSVDEGKEGASAYKVSITVADVDASVRVTESAGLRDAVVKAIEENGMPNGAGVILRVSDGEDVRVFAPISRFYPQKVEGKKNEGGYQLYEFLPAEAYADYFVGMLKQDENWGPVFSNWDGGSGLTVEVIPTIHMNMGSATKAGFLDKSSERVDRESGETKTITGDQYLREFGSKWVMSDNRRGFTPCVVTFAAPQGVNEPSFISLKTTSTQPVFVDVEAIETPHIKPSGLQADALRVEDGVDLSDYDPSEFEDAPAAAAQSPRRDRGVGM